MKITIVQKQYFEGKRLVQSNERICYPETTEELKITPIGFMAEKIKLEVEFDKKDIPNLIEFLKNCEPCFG